MKKRLIFLLLLFVLLSACNDIDELSGQTFNLSAASPNNPNKYYPVMTLEFSDGNKVSNTVNDKEGTYALDDDELAIHFKNENENLDITFTLQESSKDISEYTAEISEIDFEMTDMDKVSHFKNMGSELNGYTFLEFIKK